MRDFLKVVAIVFHPLFMPLYAAIIALYFVGYIYFAVDPSIKTFLFILLSVNVVAPAISMGTMISRKMISDVQVSNKKERFIPFTLMLFYYSISYILLRNKLGTGLIPDEIYSMILSVIVSLVIVLLVSFRFKISIHALGVSGVLGAVSALAHKYQFHQPFNEFFWISALGIILGLVGASRIYTKNHTLPEIFWGTLVGFVVNYYLVYHSIVF